MTCPTCGSPRPEERRYVKLGKIVGGGTLSCLCQDSFHNQILDPEEREKVLPSQY